MSGESKRVEGEGGRGAFQGCFWGFIRVKVRSGLEYRCIFFGFNCRSLTVRKTARLGSVNAQAGRSVWQKSPVSKKKSFGA